MISSGLVVQKRARFEEGHPSDHNRLNRYVHEERPYVQTKIYSQLPPSEYADPELKPRYTVLSETKYEHLFEHQLTPDERLYLFEQATQSGGQIGRTYGNMPTYNVNTPMVLPHETNVEDGRMDGTASPNPNTNPTPNLYPEVGPYEPVVISDEPVDDLVIELNAETFIERFQNGVIDTVGSGVSAVGSGVTAVVRGVGNSVERMIWDQVSVKNLFKIMVPADLYAQLMIQTGTELSIRAVLPPFYAEKVINFGRSYIDAQTRANNFQRRIHEGVTDYSISAQRSATDYFNQLDFAEQFKNVFSNARANDLAMINYQPDSTDMLLRSAGENAVGLFPTEVFVMFQSLIFWVGYILSAPGRRGRNDNRVLRRIATNLNGIYWEPPTGPRRLN